MAPPDVTPTQNIARRSLHVWPLESPTREALMEFAKKFFQMLDDDFAALQIVRITPCPQLPQSKIRDEFCVEFETISDRDVFKSYASRLRLFQRCVRKSMEWEFHEKTVRTRRDALASVITF